VESSLSNENPKPHTIFNNNIDNKISSRSRKTTTPSMSAIILIRPRIDISFSQANPPIGLGYLASSLEKAGFRVYILDLAIYNITDQTLVDFVKRKAPILIGISSLSAYYMAMKHISRTIKLACPEIPIVLGGIHVSSLPEASLNESSADFVVIGEGERTIIELANCIDKKNLNYADIKGIAYKEGADFVITQPRELVEDLDSLPIPSWHKIDPHRYPAVPHGFIMKHRPVAPILSTRGCPYDCSYCASCQFWHRRIRFRTPEKIVDEVEYLYNHFHIREFHFWDDNLTLKRSHIVDICKEILKRGLNISIATPNGVRVDTLKNNILRLMKATGFYHLTFSVESGSIAILRANNKKTSLSTIIKNTIMAKQLGFGLNGFFMIGFPQDTIRSIRKTINLAKSLPFDMHSFFIVQPLPGSGLFDAWVRKHELIDFNWDSINYFHVEDVLANLDKDVIINWMHRAYKETIMRVPNIFQYFFFRFIKHGHLYQLKFLVTRVIYILYGFNARTQRVGLKS
jgi:anaerobic magnesium-protoporphyrin IX monomethyl ester cyclase